MDKLQILQFISFRPAGLFNSAPAIGHRSIPAIIKAGIAVITAIILIPLAAKSSLPENSPVWLLELPVANELLIGLIIGSFFSLLLKRIKIARGTKRLFSIRFLVQLIRDVMKISLIGYIGYKSATSGLDTLCKHFDNSVGVFAGIMGGLVLTTVLELGAIIMILALFGYAYQKHDF